jgi:hypothetical protein
LCFEQKRLRKKQTFLEELYTWWPNLLNHPHLHCVVPGGGLSLDGKRWISSRKNFFLPVKVMSSLFRGKFLAYLEESYNAGKPGSLQPHQVLTGAVQVLLAKLRRYRRRLPSLLHSHLA